VGNVVKEGVTMPRQEDNDVIDFTPENGFAIEKLAPVIVKAMNEMDMDAQINLPGKVVIEIERECTEQEIVVGYNNYMAQRIRHRLASNKNEKK
jgi:hypothetical protein